MRTCIRRILSARSQALFLIALPSGFLCACSSTQVERNDWSSYTGPGAEHFRREEFPFPHVDDPIEPVNRISAWLTREFLRFVVAPTARVYRFVVPETVRSHLENAGDNLLFPQRVINNLLQGNWHESAVETSRFAINTTAGVLGLFDPAVKLGLNPYPEDFGQTFAKWGWKDSLYLYLPIVGPSTLRDSVGLVPDSYTDPLTYVPDPDNRRFFAPAAIARRFNSLSGDVDAVLRLSETTYDAYQPARTLYVLNREVDITNFSWAEDKSGPTQTLQAIFLTFEDEGFPARGATHRVGISTTGRELPYTLWLQPEPAPIVYVIPGFGGHRLGNASLGLAELIYANGSSVVTLSNPTNAEFIAHAASVAVPGFTPVDARDAHRAMTAIDVDLERRHPGRFTRKHLLGLSLGAQQALFIAGREKEAAREGLIAFDVFIALNSPVNLEYGIAQLDRFYNVPLSFPPGERDERVEEIFGKVLFLSSGELQPGADLPFTRLESEFLIGLAFRLDLQFALMQSQELHDMGVLQTKRSRLRRAPAFREASEYSFIEYIYAFVLPCYAEHDSTISFDEAGARRMFEQCDLRSIADELRANERILVFANENDFLLRPEDLTWLRETLADRVHIFPAGGHLGNLHRKTIQDLIENLVRAKAAEVSETP